MKKWYLIIGVVVCVLVLVGIILYITKPVELTWKIEYSNETLQRNVIEFYDDHGKIASLTIDSLEMNKIRFSLWHEERTTKGLR